MVRPLPRWRRTLASAWLFAGVFAAAAWQASDQLRISTSHTCRGSHTSINFVHNDFPCGLQPEYFAVEFTDTQPIVEPLGAFLSRRPGRAIPRVIVMHQVQSRNWGIWSSVTRHTRDALTFTDGPDHSIPRSLDQLRPASAAAVYAALQRLDPERFDDLHRADDLRGGMLTSSLIWRGIGSDALLLTLVAALYPTRLGLVRLARSGRRCVDRLARTDTAHCPTCGYDCRGLRSALCPECGHVHNCTDHLERQIRVRWNARVLQHRAALTPPLPPISP
ncbi:hypothetical protein BH11PLA1_BH11PLA1_06010 [soil metagenome]